ncbi:MAG TPA: START domain-containing protein [Bacteroidales bacterium]|jgi:hypothetical protein|nr:START domain-containing protein [Bacteroidales bacterium]
MLLAHQLPAQSWDFVRERDGIKLYTRSEPGKPIKAFKGVTDIKAPVQKIFDVLRDINDTDWWDKNVTLNQVLYYEKNKGARYYLVYDLPWPVPDRDLCVDISVIATNSSGERRISAVSVNGIIPERNDLVRIKDYRQTWIVSEAAENLTHVELEGLVDPAGNIPDWIINMLIIESPYKSISGLRKRMNSYR